MNVLITGASGLIGGRVIDALIASGAVRVHAASRIARAWPVGVIGVVLEPRNAASIAAACAGMTAVINLASMPDAECAADPMGALIANAGGTLALAGAAIAAGVPRFVQLSTFKVYGNGLSGAITEDTPTRPQTHYAITHRAAEDYACRHPNAVVLRLANGFGAPVAHPAHAWSVIVNRMCMDAVSAQRITLQGDGRSWRNFVPMPDIVEAIEAARGELPGGIYNLGSAASDTLRGMADRVARVSERMNGVPVRVVVGPPESKIAQPEFAFSADRLRAAGLGLTASVDAEIERTLRAAQVARGHA